MLIDIYQAIVRHQHDGIDPLIYTAFMTKRILTTWDYKRHPFLPSQRTLDGIRPGHVRHWVTHCVRRQLV